MVRMFDRWFDKDAKINEADLVIGRSIEGLKLQTKAHQANWGFGKLDRWNVDLETGKIKFSSQNGFEAAAPVQVVGT